MFHNIDQYSAVAIHPSAVSFKDSDHLHTVLLDLHSPSLQDCPWADPCWHTVASVMFMLLWWCSVCFLLSSAFAEPISMVEYKIFRVLVQLVLEKEWLLKFSSNFCTLDLLNAVVHRLQHKDQC